jgi:hypothetical protein
MTNNIKLITAGWVMCVASVGYLNPIAGILIGGAMLILIGTIRGMSNG